MPGSAARASTLWRSLWLQSAWSQRDMQTLGFVRALEPVLATRYPEEEERAGALLRYMEFFNTHPILASAVLGAIVRHEAQGEVELSEKTVKMLMGPFGGMGDSFFWGALKPLFILIALAAVQQGQLWVAVAMVVGFALINVISRVCLLNLGISLGRRVVVSVQRLGLMAWAQRIKVLASLLTGWVMVVALAQSPAAHWGIGVFVLAAAATFLALVVAWGARREVDPLWMVILCSLLAVGGSVLI